MKRNWWSKKYQRWTGKDMFLAVITITGVGTILCSLPIVGVIIKEYLD